MSSKGLAGITAADSTLSRVDGQNGELIYRGYNIMDLGEKATFEEVVYLLWNGELPNQAQLDAFKAALVAMRSLPTAVLGSMTTFPREAHPMAVLRTIVSGLGLTDPNADDISLPACGTRFSAQRCQRPCRRPASCPGTPPAPR